jgi:DNA polymerase-3 subunit alpha
MSYCSLHTHSYASLRDGSSSPKEMAAEAVKYHQNAIAITDHASVSMIPQFYQECLAAGVKPILGNEMYICSDVTLKDRTYHLIVLAKKSGRL